MKQFPRGGIIGKTVRAVRAVSELKIPLHAANAGFFIILSLFPALVLTLSLLRYTGLSVETLMDVLGSVIPAALRSVAEDLIVSTYENSTGVMVGISALTALWSASRGIYGLLTGLNAVYGVSEDRGYFHTRFISVVYTFAFLLVLMLTLIFHVFGRALIRFLERMDAPFLLFVLEMVDFRFYLLLFVQTLLFTVMFMVLPNGFYSFRGSMPGALLASSGWLVFSDLFSRYVEYFPRYANVYGSVYAIALSMLWIYCCLSIVFYGGALNRYLMKR